jgi:hypothetical protein
LLNDPSVTLKAREHRGNSRAKTASSDDRKASHESDRRRDAERQRDQDQPDHGCAALNPGESQDRDGQRAGQETYAGSDRVSAVVTARHGAQGLHDHDKARDDDQPVADNGKGR